MKFRSNLGAANLVVIAAIALAVYAWHEYSTLFASGRNRKGADTAAVTSAQSSQQATSIAHDAGVTQAAVEDLKKAHAQEIAGRDQADSAAAGDMEIVKAALQTDKNPTAAEIIAIGYAEAAETALGVKFTDEQKAAYVKTVLPLLQDKQAALAAVEEEKTKNAALAAANVELRSRSTAAEGTATTAVANLKQEAIAHASTAARAAALDAANKKWADGEPDWFARLEALGVLIGILIVVIAAYEIHRRGLLGALEKGKNALHDAVAVKEHIQTRAIEFGADATKLKTEAETWWADDPAGKAAFEAEKAKLRL